MTTVVTGATGFIGGRVAEALVKRGEAVRALVRKTSRVDKLKSLGIEVCYGDVTDAQSVTAAMKGCDRLYHLANIYEWWLPDRKQYYRVNVDGTRNVLKAAQEAGVQRTVYTSSAVALGERNGTVGTEDTQHRGYFLSDYDRSKYMAELVAREAAAQGLPLVCVCPSGVYGPGDSKATGKLLIAYLNGKLPGIFNARTNLVYIDDVVDGHLRAMDRGKPGERYIFAGENIETIHIFRLVQDIAGLRKAPPILPMGAVKILALGYEAISKINKNPPFISRDFARFIRHSFLVDNRKAKEELEMTFLPLREGLERAVTWYRQEGYVKK